MRENNDLASRDFASLRSQPDSSALSFAGARERPILFSAPMVRALLDGRKTQTRRVVRGVDSLTLPIVRNEETGEWGWWWTEWRWEGAGLDARQLPYAEHFKALRCPYGVPGDLLWVRETWAHYQTVNGVVRSGGRSFSEVSDGLAGYRADGHDTIEDFRQHVRLTSGVDLEAVEINGDRWRPSIHMPRWASRITLRITDVRVERLQDISEADAGAEGASECANGWWFDGKPEFAGSDARGAYYCLWNYINGPGSWDANPWVWAVSFERVALAEGQAPRPAERESSRDGDL